MTCEVGAGGVRWWLTRESGHLPEACWQGLRCTRCRARAKICGEEGLRSAYIVVKVVSRLRYTAWSQAIIGQLSVINLNVALEKLVRPLDKLVLACASERTRDWESFRKQYKIASRVVSAAGQGAYSTNAECMCEAGRCCSSCCRVSSPRFIVQDRYAGVLPRGDKHWFYGVTDAIGEVSSWQPSWLQRCE